MTYFSSQGRLHPTPPYDFNKSLFFLKLLTPSTHDQVLTSRSLMKAISIDGQPIVFCVKGAGEIGSPALTYFLISEQEISEQAKFAVLDRASFFLSLYDNLDSFYKIGANDDSFNPVIQKLYGYHQVKFLTPFENACWAILCQRATFHDAKEMKDKLMLEFGSPTTVRGVNFRAFPEPFQIAYETVSHLTKLLGDEQRAACIQYIARSFDRIEDDFLRNAPYKEVNDWLMGLKGISEWGANFIMLRGLGRMDRAPIVDKQLIASAAKLYGENVYSGISGVANQYGKWQGYWAHYLKVAVN